MNSHFKIHKASSQLYEMVERVESLSGTKRQHLRKRAKYTGENGKKIK